MEKLHSIFSIYEHLYTGQEEYYHNFNHARWTVIRGCEVLDSIGASKKMKRIYSHAMSAHDGGHSNGIFEDDKDNVKKALEGFDIYCPFHKNSNSFKMAKTIILATTVPYSNFPTVEEMTYYSDVEEEYLLDLQILIEVARDVDHLGIIGIRDELLRERALIGLMKELLQKTPKEVLLKSVEKVTHDFFNSINFYTDYAKDWATNNLACMREWQLGFSQKAVELASK